MDRRTEVWALAVGWTALLAVVLFGALAGASTDAAGSTAERGRADVEVTIVWAGDITPGSSYGLPPDRGRALFEGVREEVASADLAIGNLEGTFSVGGTSKCGVDSGSCFAFQAPPENAAALAWAGFDVMGLANNHAYDFGLDGQTQTIEALAANGLHHTGQPGQVMVVERRGLRIAMVGFAPYPWANDVRDLEAVEAFVRSAAGQADLVVALAHLGAEGNDQTHTPVGTETAMGEDRGDTRAFAHAAVEAGADLVLASGPHVLRGIELHRGRPIAYSLGNFAGWHNFATAGVSSLSGLLEVRMSGDGRLRGGRFTGLRLDAAGVPALDPTGDALEMVDRLGREDFRAAALPLRADGSF